MLVNCYLVKRYNNWSRVCHETHQVQFKDDGTLPPIIEIFYSTAIEDADVGKFDPRANWGDWVEGNDPFKRIVKCEFVPGLGLTYLDEILHDRAKKRFPQLKVHKRPRADEPFMHPNAASNLFSMPLNTNWMEGIDKMIKIPLKKDKKKEEPITWIAK